MKSGSKLQKLSPLSTTLPHKVCKKRWILYYLTVILLAQCSSFTPHFAIFHQVNLNYLKESSLIIEKNKITQNPSHACKDLSFNTLPWRVYIFTLPAFTPNHFTKRQTQNLLTRVGNIFDTCRKRFWHVSKDKSKDELRHQNHLIMKTIAKVRAVCIVWIVWFVRLVGLIRLVRLVRPARHPYPNPSQHPPHYKHVTSPWRVFKNLNPHDKDMPNPSLLLRRHLIKNVF